MSPITETIIAALKAKHPGVDLHQVGEDEEAIVVRLPTRAEWKRMKAMRLEGGSKAVEAHDFLVDTCLVWPEEAAADKIFDARPALVDTYANEIAELAGVTEKVSSKKL